MWTPSAGHGNTDTVTCCDLHGRTQWEFKNKHVLQCPYGISVDNDGNVYVVGFKSNNVLVISSNGQLHIHILSSKDGLSYPIVLDYDVSTNKSDQYSFSVWCYKRTVEEKQNNIHH
jgi:DNA-binding beta-propeller fold protein YncE